MSAPARPEKTGQAPKGFTIPGGGRAFFAGGAIFLGRKHKPERFRSKNRVLHLLPAAVAAIPRKYSEVMSFDRFGLSPALLRGLSDTGFREPTLIQEQAIPPAMEGRDVLASAKTGSGKTAAFLLPILHRLLSESRGTTRALVVTPTRELAAQIDEHFSTLAYHTPLSCAAVYGGVGMLPQMRAFEVGVDLIVATPGRLLDHLRRPFTNLDQVEYLVLDEADRMLDMGFLPDIRRIIGYLPARRQTLFFSATLPQPIVKLTRDLLRDPVKINVGAAAAPPASVKHTVFPVAQESKPALLLELLQKPGIERALTFTRTRHRADRLAIFLERKGIPVALIHGARSQAQRTMALTGFKQGKFRVLVATDVAARGIDVLDLSHVVNFDVPNQPDDFIHRVGRTGRAAATGDAFTFVAPEEEGGMRSIEKAIGRPLPRRKVTGLGPPPRIKEPPAHRGSRRPSSGPSSSRHSSLPHASSRRVVAGRRG